MILVQDTESVVAVKGQLPWYGRGGLLIGLIQRTGLEVEGQGGAEVAGVEGLSGGGYELTSRTAQR